MGILNKIDFKEIDLTKQTINYKKMGKLTVQSFIYKTFDICDVVGVGQAEFMHPQMKKLIQCFLRQIRFEIRGDDSYLTPKKMGDIDDVFDEYLNEN